MTANEVIYNAAKALTQIPSNQPEVMREAILIMEQVVLYITVRGDKYTANEELGRLLRLVEKSKEGE